MDTVIQKDDEGASGDNVVREPKTFKMWYTVNKDKLSEKRKQLYHSDPEYRKKNNETSAKWRKEHPAPSRAGESRFKKYKGATIEVFRITAVAEMIGRSDQTIRGWEADGVIPKPLIESAHRYYTKKQIMLMRELAEIIDLVRYDGRELLNLAIKSKSEEIHKQWADQEQ